MKKKCYLFTLDALLGLSVLIIGLFLIYTYYVNVPSNLQSRLISDDVMNFLVSTKIQDLNDPFAGIGGTLWKQGDITNKDNNLLQQIGEFYFFNKLEIAENFLISITQNIIPSGYKYEFIIDDTLIHPSNPSQEHIDSKDNSRVLLPSRNIVYGIVENNLYGPYEIKIIVWE